VNACGIQRKVYHNGGSWRSPYKTLALHLVPLRDVLSPPLSLSQWRVSFCLDKDKASGGRGEGKALCLCGVWDWKCATKYWFLLADSRECPSDSTAIRRDMPSHGFFSLSVWYFDWFHDHRYDPASIISILNWIPLICPFIYFFFFFFAAHSFPIGKSKVSFWFFLNATTTTSYKIKTNPVQQTKKTTIRTFYLWGQSLWIGIHLISCLNSVHSSVRNKWAPHFKLFKKASLVTSLYVRLLDSSSPLQRILLNTCRCIIMASTVY